jgi:tetratricopeptide (TPR) repeat protein
MPIWQQFMAGAFGAAFGEIAEELADKAIEAAGGHGLKTLSAEALSRVAGYLGEPLNHDVARALRIAELNAARALLNAFRKTAPDRDALYLGYLDRYINEQIGLCLKPNVRFDEWSGPVLARATNLVLTGAAIPAPGTEAPPGAAAGRRELEEAVLDEFRRRIRQHDTDSVTLAPAFEAVFREGNSANSIKPWFVLYTAFLGEQVKTNERFREMFNATQIADLVGGQARLQTLLTSWMERSEALEASLTRIEARFDELPTQLVAFLEQRGMLGGLPRETVLEFAREIKPEENFDFDQAVAELKNAVAIAREVIASGQRGSNHDEFVNRVLREVATRTGAGQLDAAASEMERGLAELARRDAEQVEAMPRNRGALLEDALKLDLLRRDVAAAAARVEALVALDAPQRPAWAPAFKARQDEFFKEGRHKGLNLSLLVAAALARRMLTTAATNDERGAAGNFLGIALWTLGERETGTARLEEAVAAFRAALEERTRDRVPLDWATTQNNLALALWTLGGRESGTARLEEAVAALRAALEEWTRDRVPLQWAAAQNNLGAALQTFGVRETGTARLEEAVAAYRAALEERTRDRVPFDWAATQNNLGAALQTLGGRESGTARLEEAVAAYRAALEEYTRDRAPLEWATIQNNLGNALRTLGERESGTTRLEEAVAAYRAALDERTRERVPFLWAQTMENLALAEEARGDKTSDPARWRVALGQVTAALKEYRAAGSAFDIGTGTGLRDRLRSKLELSPDAEP